ncbi:MAG: ABC transporter ATP-binding protein [Candidatus Brockarchaeota archaeon]|nr:ABC transporter ATP-binding protein [Candidatus Brockarchaeota archaeon]
MADLIKSEKLTKIFESSGFMIGRQRVIAVEDFNLSIKEEEPEVISIAGESGSGKTTVARLMLGLIKPTSGSVYFRGKNIWKMNESEQKEYKRNVQAVFQDPYATFNPLYKVEHFLRISIKKFNLAKEDIEIEKKIEESLGEVGLKYEETIGKYPHQLSGGERQRVMIARAFALKPKLIIADEPVSMLDASIRANVLNIIKGLKEKWKISFIYITHDLSTAYYISDSIKIMYRGRVAESGPVRQVLKEPLHPYTKVLLDSIPNPNPERRWSINGKFTIESGKEDLIKGCRFYPRCSYRMEKCKVEVPTFKEIDRRTVECFLY